LVHKKVLTEPREQEVPRLADQLVHLASFVFVF